jgi:hypothetical protein
LRSAEFHARQTIRLSPHDYRPHLVLASIEESREDLEAAKGSLQQALRLAPGNLEAHWQLGVLLWRNEKLAESLEEFRAAASGHTQYFKAALELVWGASEGDVDAVEAITPHKAADRLALANFLLQQSRAFESAAVFRQIGHDGSVSDRESGRYLDSLVAAGQTTLARELWCAYLGHDVESPEANSNRIWNGGFESDILLDFTQFDWSIQPSNYARISIDSRTVHGGRRSLRVDFVGRETTRLEQEIKQLVLMRPGARYRLQYQVKTRDLVSPEGPRVVVSGGTPREWIAASDPAPAGSTDWQQGGLEFVASGPALTIAVRQQPKFSFEEPTHGTVWFDDFEIREVRQQ